MIITFLLAIGGENLEIFYIIGSHMFLTILVDLWLNYDRYFNDDQVGEFVKKNISEIRTTTVDLWQARPLK